MLNPLCWCLFASHCFNYSYLKLFLENHQQIPIVNPTLLIIDVWWTLWFHPSELAEIHVYHTWINLNHKYDINHPLQLHYNYINLQRKFQKTIDSRWTTQKKTCNYSYIRIHHTWTNHERYILYLFPIPGVWATPKHLCELGWWNSPPGMGIPKPGLINPVGINKPGCFTEVVPFFRIFKYQIVMFGEYP